ncbi:gamma carbonic anhydrase family protein [Salipaludibacillus agaradhaerens]|uniref:Gamma carbonic anhydrase family protein n=1 Tax=Salipaludibacillus agaradhaerens TaxID=76935 RepID=A0A9Q4AZB2_SALAG|nr:gamma carbonic anhydrase family protein [Salipaludibacillus agaradhaerens]MCR6095444.1 gamma carbonic anhydrase family protein [Salipaludibacillus agaradhaerens]MCR6114996.1 gamma carbonic anhydrase family protein [Salipaludibacillus agaradhaerens]
MTIYPYNGKTPLISEEAFIATGVIITGDVTIHENTSIWFNTVIRGDVAPTIIEKNVNVQDNSTLHQSPNIPLHLKEGVTVGHQCTLHSCLIHRHALIGMGSLILDGAEIGEEAFIGAGSLVPPGKKIPPRTLALGHPAKVIRELTDDDFRELKRIREDYMAKAAYYKRFEEKKRNTKK